MLPVWSIPDYAVIAVMLATSASLPISPMACLPCRPPQLVALPNAGRPPIQSGERKVLEFPRLALFGYRPLSIPLVPFGFEGGPFSLIWQ
jgi:hypothetical protein